MSEADNSAEAKAKAIGHVKEFIAQTRQAPLAALSDRDLIYRLVQAEQHYGAALGGAAAELGRRLAGPAGSPAPELPPDHFPALSTIGDRGLGLFLLHRAEEFHAGASPQVSEAALAIEQGVARLWSKDPELAPR